MQSNFPKTERPSPTVEVRKRTYLAASGRHRTVFGRGFVRGRKRSSFWATHFGGRLPTCSTRKSEGNCLEIEAKLVTSSAKNEPHRPPRHGTVSLLSAWAPKVTGGPPASHVPMLLPPRFGDRCKSGTAPQKKPSKGSPGSKRKFLRDFGGGTPAVPVNC